MWQTWICNALLVAFVGCPYLVYAFSFALQLVYAVYLLLYLLFTCYSIYCFLWYLRGNELANDANKLSRGGSIFSMVFASLFQVFVMCAIVPV
jgi:hypothetical protein